MSPDSSKKTCLYFYWFIFLLLPYGVTECGEKLDSNKQNSEFLFYLSFSDSCIRKYELGQAKIYLDSASFVKAEVRDSILLGYYHQLLGIYFTHIRDDSEAHDNYFKAIDYYESADQIQLLSPIYYNLAISYIQQQDTNKIKQIIDKMQSISLKQKNEIHLMNLFEIKAYYYSCLYEKRNQQHNVLDSIILYENKAISIFENNSSIQYQKPDISYNYLMLADNLIKKKEYNTDSIIDYIRKAEQWAYPADTAILVNCLWVEGEIAYKSNNYKDAENIFNKQLTMIDQWTNKGNFSQYVDLYDRLSKISEVKANHTSALEYERKKINFLNTIHDAEKYRIVEELQIKYETNRKDQEIRQLHEISRFRTKIEYLYIGLLILSLLSLFFIIRSMRLRKKAADSQLQLVEKEKKEIESQAKLQESQLRLKESQLRLKEEQTRLKEEKLKKVELEKYEALLDNHFKDIALKGMDNDMITLKEERENLNDQIRDFSERIHLYERNIQLRKTSKISDNYYYSIIDELNTSIVEKLRTFYRQKEYIANLQDNRQRFFLKLKEAGMNWNDLSGMNLKYYLAFAIGMNTEDISSCFGVELRSVHMARHRLKSKLQIDKSVDFDWFLKQ